MSRATQRLFATIALILCSATFADARQATELHRRGLEFGYNLDYDDALALATFDRAIAEDPDDAAAHRLAAATVWMRILFAQGAVTVEDYLGQARAKVERPPPPPDLSAMFHRYADRAIAIAERRARVHAADADAQFELGAAAGLRASYMATVEGRVFDSVGAARRAYSAHKRAMTLDPRRKDAGLIVGLYQYGVASLALPLRMMARLAGFGSGRERGLRLVESASEYNSDAQTNARFCLVLLYNREGRPDAALRIVRDLQRQYPRNRLLWLEAAGTALRAQRPAEALQAIDTGLAQFADDPRPRAFNEAARWRRLREQATRAIAGSGGAR